MNNSNHMEEIWPAVELGFQDKDAKVRKAACIAVSCLCQWLEDNCIEKHAVLVPVSNRGCQGSVTLLIDLCRP